MEPLSKTHPTLWNVMSEYQKEMSEYAGIKDVQSCSVDKAQHEEMKKWFESEYVPMDEAAQISHEAFKAGEKKALVRVRETIEKMHSTMRQLSRYNGQPHLSITLDEVLSVLDWWQKELNIEATTNSNDISSRLVDDSHRPCDLNCYTEPGVQCGCKCHKEEKK